MNNPVIINIVRWLLIMLLQVLVLRQIELGPVAGNMITIVVFPLFILLLPLRISVEVLLLISFFSGLLLDMFYDTPGLHSSAAVFLGFCRPVVLRQLEPRGGYNITYGPTPFRFGFSWFLRYAAIMTALYLLWYFSLDEFSFREIIDILIKWGLGLILSLAFTIILVLIFNPKD